MKGVCAFLVLSPWLSLVTADNRLIPFDHFHVSVDTNWRSTKGGEGQALRVYVQVSRSDEDPEGTTKTEVRCPGFDSREQEFLESDLQILFEAFEAARKGETYQREILSWTFLREVPTRFEVATAGKKHIVRVSRGKAEVYFTLAEAERTSEALAHARAAEEWYRTLLAATKLPAITEEAHPPVARAPYVSSTVGKVPGGGFAFEIGVRCWGDDVDTYQVEHSLSSEDQGWWSAGNRVEDLIATISEAIDAGKAGKTFKHQFDSGRSGKGDAIFVTVNPATGQAEVMIKFGEGLLSKRPIAFGTFGEKELKAIHQLEAEAEVRRKWFEEHESLFRVPPPRDP